MCDSMLLVEQDERDERDFHAKQERDRELRSLGIDPPELCDECGIDKKRHKKIVRNLRKRRVMAKTNEERVDSLKKKLNELGATQAKVIGTLQLLMDRMGVEDPTPKYDKFHKQSMEEDRDIVVQGDDEYIDFSRR